MRLPLLLALSGMMAIAGTLTLAAGPLSLPGAEVQALSMQQGAFELAIDADIENGNGPCDPIDDEADVAAGATHRVAVCILNPPEPPYAFLVRVWYDGELNTAPTLPALLPAVDANPDANAGETTFSDPDLGERWNCTGFGIYPPMGDDPYTPEKKDAVLACIPDLRDPDTTLVQGGPLAVVTFVAVGKGDDHLEFDPTTEIGGDGETMGTCGSVPATTIPCRGAVLHIAGGGPAATGSPEASSEASPEASVSAPTPGRTPAGSPERPTSAAVETGAEGRGGFPWAVLGGALGGATLLVALIAGLYAWRRSSRPNT